MTIFNRYTNTLCYLTIYFIANILNKYFLCYRTTWLPNHRTWQMTTTTAVSNIKLWSSFHFPKTLLTRPLASNQSHGVLWRIKHHTPLAFLCSLFKFEIVFDWLMWSGAGNGYKDAERLKMMLLAWNYQNQAQGKKYSKVI